MPKEAAKKQENKQEDTLAIDQLNGLDKAAIFMLALGEEKAAFIMENLDEFEVCEISKHMATLGTVDASIVEDLYLEFASQMSEVGDLHGSYMSAERLLHRVFDDDKVASIMEEIRGPAGRTLWDKLSNVNEQTLTNYLKNEYPQTVAVILSKLKINHTARILALMPESFALEIIHRMLSLDTVQRGILDDVENTLKKEFMTSLSRSSKKDPYGVVADIFNAFDRKTETRFMGLLEKSSMEKAEKIRTLMFTFEDLVKLDPPSIQTLLRTCEKARLALALKGAPEAVKTLFFSCMSERASRLMKEDMEAMGMVKLKDVDQAQTEIINITKELAARGDVMIASDSDEDVMVE